MKPKPTSHKATNTYKFQSFHDKIKNTRISLRKFILKKDRFDNEVTSHFWSTLNKWKENNLTLGFKSFVQELRCDCQSVEQVKLNEIVIAEVLQTHILKSDILVLPTLLDLLVAFAGDLPDLFYQKYFFSFITKLRGLLTTKEHEILEHVFVCFLSLFTILQKSLNNDIITLYIDYEFSTLFSNKYPWYITELAAQSISFLVRKLTNKRDFFIVAFRRLKKNKDEIDGVGKLLFNCMKSDVARRLHSSTSSILSLALEVLTEEEIPLENSTAALCCTLKTLAAYITAANQKLVIPWEETWSEDSKKVWPILLDKLAHENCLKINSDTGFCDSILQCILTLTQFKKGALVVEKKSTLCKVLSVAETTNCDITSNLIVEITAQILVSPHLKLSSSYFKEVSSTIFTSKFSFTVIDNFVDKLVHSDLFDDVILPLLVQYSASYLSLNKNTDNLLEVLRTLGKILLVNKPIIQSGEDLKDYESCYTIDFSKTVEISVEENNCISTLMIEILNEGVRDDLSNLEALTLGCYCLPHLTPFCHKEISKILLPIFKKLLNLLPDDHSVLISENLIESITKKKIKKSVNSKCPEIDFNISLNSDERYEEISFLLSTIVESLLLILPQTEFIEAFAPLNLVTIINRKMQLRESKPLLRTLDLYLTVVSQLGNSQIINESNLQMIYPAMAPALASSDPVVRLLVTHILSLFPAVLPHVGKLKDNDSVLNIFKLMFQAESAAVSAFNFRTRINLLNKLDYENIDDHKPISGIYDQAAIIFLLGQLYINFKELWPPVMKALGKYALSFNDYDFWLVWLPKLKVASHFTYQELCNNSDQQLSLVFEESIIDAYWKSLFEHSGMENLKIEPDHKNYRDLMWQTMQEFPQSCESKHTEIVKLFFDFLYKELFPLDCSIAPTQDVSQHLAIEENLDDSQEEDPESVEPESKKRVNKAPTKSLCEQMILFSKFKNLKAIHRSEELEQIFYEFLRHPYQKAQIVALDAIMAFNYKYLTTYKDSLYRMLDDKTFKDEITLFSINDTGEDNGRCLKAEHRDQFIPVLMRILYGKMQYKTGTNSAGKSNSAMRRAVVLRFLAGTQESELETFLNLSFDVLLSHLEGSATEIVDRVNSTLDPQKVIPIKRLSGALGTLETMFDMLGHLLNERKPFVLKVVLFVLSTAVNLLENKSEVCSHFYPSLKNVKQLAIQKVIAFFTNYQDYPWTLDEIDAVFRAAIWPSLDRIRDEGIYSSTPLLRLLHCFTKQPRLHALLAKHHHEDMNLTPMPHLIRLINHPKCSPNVITDVYDLIGNLVTLKSDPDDYEINSIPLEYILPTEDEAVRLNLVDLSKGETIVLLNMEDILKNMKSKFLTFKPTKGQSMHTKDLVILIKLSEWIHDNETGQEFLELIVPLLARKLIRQPEKVAFLLNVCAKLLKITPNADKYLSTFVSMFSFVNGRISRAALCDVIEVIASQNDDYKTLSKWATHLNAWNLMMVDQFDYELRYSCYREISQYLSTISIMDETLINFLIIHNYWVLMELEDKGLLNHAVLCFGNLVSMVERLQPQYVALTKKVLETMLLPKIKLGIRNKTETVRNSFINILCSCVHKCHSHVSILKDLMLISNSEDLDVDFLTNMCHIQRSRRARALSRLVDLLLAVDENGTQKISFHLKTMADYLIPIVTSFLFKQEYASDDNLINGSVKCLRAFAMRLPWKSYHNMLKYYLILFTKNISQLKLGVRVVEAIMDAFHEDVCEIDLPIMSALNLDNKTEENADDEQELDLNVVEDAIQESKKVKAQKVYSSLVFDLIPRLQKVLGQRSQRDSEHKVNKKKYPEDEDIKRIPIALALVKMIKKLPKKVVNKNVHGILIKLIDYLKSRAESIRREARNMMVRVMKELGGDYFAYFVKDINAILTRGYQSHVMVYTIHAVLSEFLNQVSASNIGDCIDLIMEICIEDLFGERAEEKEVKKIVSKVKEAKTEKGFSIIGMVSEIVSAGSLQMIMIPLRDVLQTHDKKIVNRVATCLQRVANGLDRNKNITIEHKSIFIYGVLTDKISELTNKKVKKQQQISRRPADCFLIAPEPRKLILDTKITIKVTSYIVIEFALRMLYNLLRHSQFDPKIPDHCGLLDSYTPIISDCLQSDYPEVSVFALNSISLLLKYPLVSLKENINKISDQMFILLNKFASSGLTKGKIYDLVQLCFKTLSSVIKDIDYFELNEEQLRVLLIYARNNLEDRTQRHSSFTIIKSLISRKVNVPELHDLMDTIKEASIMSSSPMIDQARCSALQYILNYAKSKRQQINFLMFYIDNISYEIPEGRLSAQLMTHDLISKFPDRLFSKDVENRIWFKLMTQLPTETSKEHRALLQKSLKTLFRKSDRKQMLIQKCLKLMQDTSIKDRGESASVVNMAVQCLLSFLENPVNLQPSLMLTDILPEAISLLHPSRYQPYDKDTQVFLDKQQIACMDRALEKLLTLVNKLLEYYMTKDNLKAWNKLSTENLWKYMHDHLLYPNLNVRLRTATIYGKLFARFPPAESKVSHVASSAEQVKELIVRFCEQLNSHCLVETPLMSDLALEVVRNLVYLIWQGRKVPFRLAQETKKRPLEDDDDIDLEDMPEQLAKEDTKSCSIFAKSSYDVLHRVGVMAYYELKRKGNSCTSRREAFLFLMGGVVEILGDEFQSTPLIVNFIISHVTRELTDPHLPQTLSSKTKDLEQFLKKKLGAEMYNNEMLDVKLTLDKKKSERRARAKESFVNNPEVALVKKAKKQVAKKISKKRKLQELKLIPTKKRKVRDFAIIQEE